MLKITLDNVGKRFNRGWVFKDLSCDLTTGQALAILGANGSGKSTLLRLLSGSLSPSQGERHYTDDGETVGDERVYSSVSISAPYLDLVDAYTLEEHIAFHFKFKGLVAGVELNQVPEILGLEGEKNKPIRDYSSGMQQRVKLGLAILSDSAALLLDEPASNLDAEGVTWFNNLLEKYGREKLVVICSNSRSEEYQFCTQELLMENYR